VAQGVGSELTPQYYKKKEKTDILILKFTCKPKEARIFKKTWKKNKPRTHIN
jgi:hypothetical protein